MMRCFHLGLHLVCQLVVSGMFLLLQGMPAGAETLAHWRFEQNIDGSNQEAVTDLSGNGNQLRGANPQKNIKYTDDHSFPALGNPPQANAKSVAFDLDELRTVDGCPLNTLPLGPRGSNAWTIELFFKLDPANRTQFQVFLGKDGSPVPNNISAPLIQFKYYPNYPRMPQYSYRLVLEITDGAGQDVKIASLEEIVPDKWYAVAATASATELTFWLKKEGDAGYVRQSSAPLKGALYDAQVLNKPWVLGRGQYRGNPADSFKGKLDEVRFSNEVLDPSQFLVSAAPLSRAGAGKSAALPAGELIRDGQFKEELTAWAVTQVEGSSVTWAQTPAGPVVTANVKRPPGISPWQVALHQWIHQELPAGQSLLLIVKMRSPTQSKVNVFLENTLRPTEKLIQGTDVALTKEFQDYTFTGSVPQRFLPAQTHMTIHMGLEDGLFEIASIRMMALDLNASTPTASMNSPSMDGSSPRTDGWVEIPLNGSFFNHAEGWRAWGEGMTLEHMPAGGPKRAPATRVQIHTRPSHYTSQHYLRSFQHEIPQGSTVHIFIMARSADRLPLSGRLESRRNDKPVTYLQADWKLTEQWQLYQFFGVMSENHSFDNYGQWIFHLGSKEGTLEFAGLQILYLPLGKPYQAPTPPQ